MAIDSTVNGNRKRSASDADLRIVDGSTPKRVHENQQRVDPFVQLRQRSVFGRYLDTVQFLVGPDAQPFVLHIGLLIHRCPAFAQAVLPENIVAQRQDSADLKVHLEHQDARVFSIFSVWLYTRYLIRPPSANDRGDCSTEGIAPEPRLVSGIEDKRNNTWKDVDLVELYLFGQRYGIHKLANAAISALWAQNMRLRRSSSAPAVKKTLSAITGKGTLWQYFSEEAALQSKQWQVKIEERNDAFPARFIPCVRLELDKHNNLGFDHTQTIKAPCRYHTHEGIVEQPHCEKQQRAARKPGKKFSSEYYEFLQDVGTVLVGPSKTPFTVHRGLMSARSEYFRGAFEGQFAEGESGIIKLDEEDPIVLIMLLHVLYESLRRPDETDRNIQAQNGDNEVRDLALDRYQEIQDAGIELWLDDLIDLYILCDRRGIPSVRHRIMDELTKRRPDWVLVGSSLERISKVWNNLPPAALCKFLVDEAACEWHNGLEFKNDIGQLPSDFLARVIQAALEVMNGKTLVPEPAWEKGAEIYYNDYEPDRANSPEL
ncbi:hypothetical protein HII31_06475 [Pseudocercospora fuligena]|uniref:BTB domain-containing protein n=1 Tax=Pseudocercospora fuligena TaxID=685502 RepID=A0A8H6VL61_9PEZI|nr:hypothetical protein HII31_06475 [Pseudocercospora fuligena]